MDKRDLAVGFGILFATAAVGVLLADHPVEAFRRVVLVNGLAPLFLWSCPGFVDT